jgi:hypothetical protein
MKKPKSKKDFDAVQYMRFQKKALAKILEHKTNAEILEYFKKKGLSSGVRPSAK